MKYNVNNLLEFENVITTPTHTLTHSLTRSGLKFTSHCKGLFTLRGGHTCYLYKKEI